MKNIRNIVALFLFSALALPLSGISQDGSANNLTYGVYRSYPSLFISKEQLLAAQTLSDLNKKYEAAWVKTYVSVEVMTTYKGATQKALSNSIVLSQEQKEMMQMADAGTDIRVNVQYLPDNTLTQNDVHELGFTFAVDPETGAEFPGGQPALEQYLQEKIGHVISTANFNANQLAVAKFTVDETGHVSAPQLFWQSANKNTDQQLLEAITNMPDWKPATYPTGVKVKQEFVLTAGDMASCVVNLIHIRRD